MHVHITDKVKVKSPLDLSDAYAYEGPIESVDLSQQRQNYILLKQSLEPFGLTLNYIWFAKFNHETRRTNGEKYNVVRYHFLAKDETCQIYWRKYEAKSLGSGQNLLYFNGHKYKLTEWLALDTASRGALLEKHGVTPANTG